MKSTQVVTEMRPYLRLLVVAFAALRLARMACEVAATKQGVLAMKGICQAFWGAWTLFSLYWGLKLRKRLQLMRAGVNSGQQSTAMRRFTCLLFGELLLVLLLLGENIASGALKESGSISLKGTPGFVFALKVTFPFPPPHSLVGDL